MPECDEEGVGEYIGELELVAEEAGDIVPYTLELPEKVDKGEEEKPVLPDGL